MKNYITIAIFSLLPGLGATLFSQDASDVVTDTTSLPEILIKSTAITEQMRDIPAAVHHLDQEEIQRGDLALLTNSLNRKPGIYTQEGALNNSRITIRGIGARSQYGTDRIKTYFNEIPITTGDGQTVFNDIDPGSVESMEIIKGPNSSIYGSGLGGVINIYALEPRAGASFAKAESTMGSFGLLKNSLSVGAGGKSKSFFASYNQLQNDGFRENSQFDRKTLTLHGKLTATENSHLSYIGNFTRLMAFIPSSINRTDYENNPHFAAANWNTAQGFESYDRFLMGLAYSTRISDKLQNTTSIFVNNRDAYEPRPFDILTQQSFNLGARTRFNYDTDLSGIPVRASLGGEYLNENYYGSNFENLYAQFPGQGSIRGIKIADIEQQRRYFNAFAQLQMEVTPTLKLVSGINLNQTDYSLNDLFAEENPDDDGEYSFETVWSPRFAALYKLTKNKNLYANVSKGFSIPTVEETLTPEGSINTTLKPEIGWNYEIGFKGNWFDSFYTEVSLYSIQISNLLVARRVAEDQYVGLNAGKTTHNGAEVLLQYKWNVTPDILIEPYFSGSFHDFKFDEFIDGDDDFSGNDLTGVPEKTINIGLDISTKTGFSFYSNMLYVSEIPLNDANSAYTNSYSLVNIKAVYNLPVADSWEVRFTAGANNLLDESYAVSILPNAIGFGGSEPRYFYPGNPRNYFGGIGVGYLF